MCVIISHVFRSVSGKCCLRAYTKHPNTYIYVAVTVVIVIFKLFCTTVVFCPEQRKIFFLALFICMRHQQKNGIFIQHFLHLYTCGGWLLCVLCFDFSSSIANTYSVNDYHFSFGCLCCTAPRTQFVLFGLGSFDGSVHVVCVFLSSTSLSSFRYICFFCLVIFWHPLGGHLTHIRTHFETHPRKKRNGVVAAEYSRK